MLEEGWFSLTGRHIRDAYEVLTPRSRKEGLTQSFTTSVEAYSYNGTTLYMNVLSSQKKRKKIEDPVHPPSNSAVWSCGYSGIDKSGHI